MNGIIHMCTHGNDAELVVAREREQLVRIFAFTDKARGGARTPTS